MSATALSTAAKRPIFVPGFRRRLLLRFGPLFGFYIASIPAGFIRAYADDIGLPVRESFTAVESVLLTAEPSRWLQHLFLDVHFLQQAAFYVYFSWFFMPVSAGLPLILTRPKLYWRLIAFLLLTYYAGMAFFILYPLEPPWLHAPEIQRVIALVVPETVGKDPNPYAAMPSLHVALPAAAALWYGWRHPYGKLFWGYSALIGLTVVYTGDHYLADIAGGYLLAWAAYALARRSPIPLLDDREEAVPAGESPAPLRPRLERQRQRQRAPMPLAERTRDDAA